MIYADYNGSAPPLPAVREYLKQRLDSEIFANPNAIHSLGQKIHKGIETCREMIAQTIGCFPDQLYFNSGSSEGISHVLFSVLEYAPAEKRVVITGPIEHVVIPKALSFYQERRGFKIYETKVHPNGTIDLESFQSLLEKHHNELALVCIMAANNETGVIQPYEDIARLCKNFEVEFLSDTTQLMGKGDFCFESSGMDYAICSGHKVGALPGTGFVISKTPGRLRPYIFGSTQERGIRGGTQNYLGIETLAVAFNDFNENKGNLPLLAQAREEFEFSIKKSFPEVVILGQDAPRLAGVSLIGYPGIHSQAVQIELETHDIFVTTSAACSDNQPETSAVLKAMGVSDDIGRGVVRISLSYLHGHKEYQKITHALQASYRKLARIDSF
jgi:cysteine desulfurase